MKRFVALSLVLVAVLMSGCAISRTPMRYRIALLAPFEGRDREIGYEALYAARLAIAEAGSQYDLLPIDDGGTSTSVVDRACALVYDPSVVGILLVGSHAETPQIRQILMNIRNVMVSHESVLILAPPSPLNPDLARRYRESAEFAPPPTDLAQWTYDAMQAFASIPSLTLSRMRTTNEIYRRTTADVQPESHCR